MTRRDEVSLRQMLAHSREAMQLADGRSRSDLDSDRLFNLALTRLLEIVGEAAGRVSQATRDCHPQIAWSQIVGLRNRLITDTTKLIATFSGRSLKSILVR